MLTLEEIQLIKKAIQSDCMRGGMAKVILAKATKADSKFRSYSTYSVGFPELIAHIEMQAAQLRALVRAVREAIHVIEDSDEKNGICDTVWMLDGTACTLRDYLELSIYENYLHIYRLDADLFEAVDKVVTAWETRLNALPTVSPTPEETALIAAARARRNRLA